MNSRMLGAWGEDLAANHLERAGWTILHRNFRTGRNEIDLIARRGRTLAFVEVKTRRGEGLGHPLHALIESKRRAIRRVAEDWIERFGRRGLEYRFDAISVVCREVGGVRLQHVENAWGIQ